MPLAPDDVYAGFTIVRPIAVHGSATLYLATRPGTGTRVALKIFDLDVSSDTVFRRRLQHSVDMVSTVGDPAIAQIVDSGRERGQLWIATEYIDGLDSGQLLREKYPSGVPRRAIDLMAHVGARALDRAHRRGLVHGGITPANILLGDPFSKQYRIVLTDFGQHLDVNAPYAAPEELSGAEATPQSDQFSFAATLFHLLTGRVPFPDDLRVVTEFGHLHFDAAALPGDAPGLAAVFGRAFAFDPKDRFETCGAFAAALVEGGDSAAPPRPAPPPAPVAARAPAAPVAAPAAEPAPSTSDRSGRSVGFIAAAAVLAVIALTAALVVWNKPKPVAATANNTVPTAPATEVASAPSACAKLDALVAQMPLRQKLAQLLMVGVTGITDARDVVGDYDVGGIFIGSGTDKSMLTDGSLRALKGAGPLPLAVSVDEEGGRVQRLSNPNLLGSQPSARDLVTQYSPAEVREIARKRGEQMRAWGITIDFAPVVDVTDAPANTVIGDRSFSADPQTVIEYAGAYADGLRDADLLPVLKHFPGHGHASGDSHQGGVTTPSLDSLKQLDLVPYAELLKTPSPVAVMVGHMNVPGLTEGLQASMSPAAYSLLREGSYGGPAFHGLVFTDDLSQMRAITDSYTVPEAVRIALQAGADVALWSSTDQVPAVLDRLEAAVNSQQLDAGRVDDALRHVAVSKDPTLAC